MMENPELSENEKSEMIIVEKGDSKEEYKRALFNLCSALKEIHIEGEDL